MKEKRMTIKKINGAWGRQLLCLSLLGASFVAVPVIQANAQSNDVLNRINRLENELDTLNRAVYRGEMPDLTPMPGAQNAAPVTSGTIPNGEVRLQQLEKQLRDLTGRVEEQQYGINQLKAQLDDMRAMKQKETAQLNREPKQVFSSSQFATPQAMQQAPGQVAQPGAGGVSVLAQQPTTRMQTVTPGGVSSSDPTLQYEQAFADLKSERYAQAQKGFEGFLNNHKDHVLASNAKYWLGETFYVQGNFDKSARIFAEGYRSYPDSPKAPDNLLKLGMSLAGLGKKDDACVALGQLPKKHAGGPGPVLSRGAQEMERLGCS